MPRNGSGTYTLPQAAFVPGTTISSAAVNSDFSDIATALTGSVAADGQTPMTGQFKALAGSALLPGLTFSSNTDVGFFLTGINQIGVAISGVAVGYFSSVGWTSVAGVPTGVPIGTVDSFAGSTAPTGWILCYGQAVSRTTYALLFAIIGTAYGSGDGVTTFNLPDCRGRVAVGVDNMGGSAAGRVTVTTVAPDGNTLGAVGGEETHTLNTAEIPSITPSGSVGINDPGHNHDSNDANAKNAKVGGVSGVSGGGNLWVNSTTSATSINTTGITANFSGNAFGGGGAHDNLQPSILFNTIIYAGA